MALKIEGPLSPPTVTSLQLAFLNELSTGIKTGKVLRTRLLIRGWDRSQIAFYRMVRRGFFWSGRSRSMVVLLPPTTFKSCEMVRKSGRT